MAEANALHGVEVGLVLQTFHDDLSSLGKARGEGRICSLRALQLWPFQPWVSPDPHDRVLLGPEGVPLQAEPRVLEDVRCSHGAEKAAMEQASIPGLPEQVAQISRQKYNLHTAILEGGRQRRPLFFRFPAPSAPCLLGGSLRLLVRDLLDPTLLLHALQWRGVRENVLLRHLRRQVRLLTSFDLIEVVGHVELSDVSLRVPVLRSADLEKPWLVHWIGLDAESIIWRVDDVSPETTDLHSRALGAVLGFCVGGQSPVGRVVASQACLERDTGVAEGLVVKPVDDPGLVLDVGLVIPIHHIFPEVVSVAVVAAQALFPKHFDVKGDIRPPAAEDLLQDIPVLEFQTVQVDNIRQRVHGVISDELHKLVCDFCNIPAVPLTNQCVAINAQKHLHPLTSWQRLVVDDLQEQDVSCQHLVVALMQVKPQLRPPTPTTPACNSLYQVPDVRAACDEDVHWALLGQRRWLGRRFPGLLLDRELFEGIRLLFMVLVPRRNTLRSDTERGGLAVPEQVQCRGVAPEVDEAYRVQPV
mmetsp:Transcript_117837/g.293890  ORF Transcript_117837/g.293890 Transcript_117837/m.293890 type:complete len:529 (+) Transcript_117837:306-1892(+)